MSCGRIAIAIALVSALQSALLPLPAWADGFCGPDTVLVRASADSVFVRHENAVKNCCLVLHVVMLNDAKTIDFYETDTGQPCDCICCFDIDISAGGFNAGRYVVRVWDATGSILFGQSVVEVPGVGVEPVLLTAHKGECQDPQASRSTTWGRVRVLYR
jgi:hypothetical protein